MHCRLLTQYSIIMVQFLAGLRKIKLLPASRTLGTCWVVYLRFAVAAENINFVHLSNFQVDF